MSMHTDSAVQIGQVTLELLRKKGNDLNCDTIQIGACWGYPEPPKDEETSDSQPE